VFQAGGGSIWRQETVGCGDGVACRDLPREAGSLPWGVGGKSVGSHGGRENRAEVPSSLGGRERSAVTKRGIGVLSAKFN